MKSNYCKKPSVKIKGFKETVQVGYEEIINVLKKQINEENFILCVDTYPGVNDKEVLSELKKLQPNTLINTIDIFKNEETITEQMKYNLTDNRVFEKI